MQIFDMKLKYLSPSCELRSMNEGQLLCVSDRSVTVDDYIVNENELDW
jgi:hypothetical protein